MAEEFTETLRQAIQTKHKDFGNYGMDQRRGAVIDTLIDFNPDFAGFSDEIKKTKADKLLKDLGEESTYGVGEAAWDMGVPLAGTTIGGGIAGPLGAAVGGAGAAGWGEARKAEWERSERGIEPMTHAERREIAKWPAALELLGGFAAPLLSKVGLGLKRRIFGVSPKNLPEDIKLAQEVLGRTDVKRGFFHPFTPLGRTLSLAQLNPNEHSIWRQLEGLAGGGFFSAGKIFKHYKGNFTALLSDLKTVMSRVKQNTDPVTFGQQVDKMLNGEINLTKILRNRYWGKSNALLDGTEGLVDVGPLMDYFAKEWGKKGKLKVGQLLTSVNDFLGGKRLMKGPISEVEEMAYLIPPSEVEGLPRQLTATQAAGLLERLNLLWGSPKIRAQAAHASGIVKEQLLKNLKKTNIEAHDAFLRASDFHRLSAQRISDGLITGILKGLKDTPEALTATLRGQNRYSNIMAIKKAMRGDLPAKRALYEQKILKPVRFDIFKDAYNAQQNVLSGEGIIKALKDRGAIFTEEGVKPGPFLKEVFGEDLFGEVHDLARTMQSSATTATGESILIKFAQAAPAIQVISGQPVPGLGTRVAGVFLAPVVLAGFLTSRSRMRTLTNGIQGGTGSTAFSRMSMTAARLFTQAQTDLRDMSFEEAAFYTMPAAQELARRVGSYAASPFRALERGGPR